MAGSNETGLTNVHYWVLTGVAITALILVVINIGVSTINADVRKEANERRQFINQSVQLGRLHNQLVQGLATLSSRSGDEELRSVLAGHGISFSVKQESAQVSSGDAAPVAIPASPLTRMPRPPRRHKRSECRSSARHGARSRTEVRPTAPPAHARTAHR